MSKQCEDEHQQTESDSSSDSTDVSLSTEPTSTELEPSFSIETSLLPDQLICENDLIAEQETEVLPQPLIIDGLIGELNAVEEDLSSPDVDESLLAEQEVTTQEILDSYGDNQTIALDFEESEGDESFDSTEVPLSGHNQIQQLLLEPVQELEEQELLTDTSDASQVESEVLEQESQPISEDEWIEQERIGLEIRDSQLDLPESSLDQIFEEPYTQEHLEQLVSDYREAFEQCSVLDQDQEPQQDDLGTPITEVERPIHAEQEDSPPALESTSTPSLETILSVNAPPSYFTPQESVSSRLFSELCLVEDSPDLSSHRLHTLEPEISPLEDYLASLDSPRLLEQFHVQLQADVTQLLLLDEAHSLPNLEDSLELVSEGPSIPAPPPYDFFQDLEDQEEANQHVSPTRNHLLRSLEQTRLRQEVANYQFALRNLPTLTNQLQPDVQTATLQKSPSSSESQVKANEQAPSSSKTTKPHKEVSITLDKFLTPQSHTEIQRYELSSERGIWGHLALHLPLLGNAGTDKFLDSLIQTKQQEHEITIALTDTSWSMVKKNMMFYASLNDIVLDPQILDTIIDWSKNQLSIELDRTYEGTKWIIMRTTTQQEFIEKTNTEVIFEPSGWGGERLKEIKTTSINQIEPQINFDEWAFLSYQYWNQLIVGGEASSLNAKGLLEHPPLITEYDQVNNSLYKMCYDIFSHGKRPYNPQYVKWKQKQRIKDKRYRMVDINIHKSQETKIIRIQMKSLWNKEENIWLIEAPISEDIYTGLKLKPREKDVKALLGQERVTEGLISYGRDLKEGDSIFIREQVSTENLPEVSREIPRVHVIAAKPDTGKYRKPDRVALILSNESTRPEIEIIIIEEKLSIKEFDVSLNDQGNGRPQSLRDALWFIVSTIEGCKEYFPNIREEDIKISCYIVTARVDKKDMIVIEGEELFRQIPASHVLPYSGLIIRSNRDLYDLIDHMKTSYIKRYTKTEK